MKCLFEKESYDCTVVSDCFEENFSEGYFALYKGSEEEEINPYCQSIECDVILLVVQDGIPVRKYADLYFNELNHNSFMPLKVAYNTILKYFEEKDE